MTSDIKILCATIGRALLALAGEVELQAAQEPAQEAAAPEKKRKSGYTLPEHPVICSVCGANFMGRGNRVKYCPACAHQIQLDKLRSLAGRKAAALAQQPPSGGMVRCERMHATIPATMCGTRGECQGKPTCPNLPGGRGC